MVLVPMKLPQLFEDIDSWLWWRVSNTFDRIMDWFLDAKILHLT